MAWMYLMDENAFPEGGMAPAYPLGVNVLVAKTGGAVYALSGRCTHMACPLFTGTLEGHTLVCPCHDWKFDIRTGRMIDSPELGIASYSVKSEMGKLYVDFG
jgi:nitrite reductase/ring-hydroxylating ferredoxin subunit